MNASRTSRLFPDDSTGFLKGADVSFIPQIADWGGFYKENNIPQDPLKIFKDHGLNCIRLKLWHTPTENYNNLDKILYMARRIKDRDLHFLLDFHYSDTWADPGRQTKPAAWTGLPIATLKDSVYDYTKRVLRALDAQNTLPDMVQLGNEINSGMLWNEGRLGGSFNTSQQWANLAGLIKEGIRGVRESCDAGDSVRIMIHIANAADNSTCRWFYDNLTAQGVGFEVIGLSFYPWWHGTLDQVKANLSDLAGRYNKDIIIAETAYPWTLQWFDNTSNIVGSASQLHTGYPASVDGQHAFLADLIKILRTVRNQKGKGLFYWAPEYISTPAQGSPWENNALFDFSGNILSSMDVFLEEPPDLTPINVTVRLNTATLMDTLGENHFTQIRGEVDGISFDTLPDGKKITWESDSELILRNVGGDYWETTFQMYPGDLLSYKFWSGFSAAQGTFHRLGWEGPITPADGLSGNRRVLVAGAADTVIDLQYYNSIGDAKEQYWKPFETNEDSIAIYFRVNMGNAMASGRFDPDMNGPPTVRGDAAVSGGNLDWEVSKLVLQQEAFSANNGSFWSGACHIPRSAAHDGGVLEYKFFIENAGESGWEASIPNRELTLTPSLIAGRGDTTLHWVYFDETNSPSSVSGDYPETPQAFQLTQNYPNPFNGQTRISYALPHATFVTVQIYDVQGKLVATLVHGRQSAGDYSVTWDGRLEEGTPASSGIYFISVVTDESAETRKAIMLK